MFSTPEQFSAATKSAFASQLLLMSTLTHKAFESVGKLVELNLAVARSAMDESSQTMKTLASARSPQEFFSLATVQAKPSQEKAIAYARGVASIASEVQADVARIAESQIADANRKVATLVDDMTRAAPAGSESMIAMFKSALGNVNTAVNTAVNAGINAGINAGYDKATAPTRQVITGMESNLGEAVTTTAKVAEKSTGRPTSKK